MDKLFIRIKKVRFMQETRKDKYREYRASLCEENVDLETTSKNDPLITHKIEDTAGTTSTLPIDQVINAIEEEDRENHRFLVKQKTKKIVIYTLIVVGLIALLSIIIWIGILLFQN